MTRKDLVFGLIALTALTALAWALTDPRQSIRPEYTPAIQAVTDIHRVAAQVDEAFAESWRKINLQPTPLADDLLVLRRLALGLTGTLPSLEEIRRFEAWPPDQRIDRHVEYLLHDRRFAEHAAERLARSFVGVEGGPFLVYRRRRFVTWLTAQRHANTPSHQIARDLIAVEGLWTNNPATNFVTVTVNDGNPDEVKLAARVSRAMLGVRLDCVQCHDDQLGDTWTQHDFHGSGFLFRCLHDTVGRARQKTSIPIQIPSC